jgi:hypothetical protein
MGFSAPQRSGLGEAGCCTAESRSPSAARFMAEMGHKHRISVLLTQPLCRKWLQYLPNFVHRSENH